VRTHRQHFRGQAWHVVQDPVNNAFFRLHAAAYQFLGMLDGRRTVAQAWRACTGRGGDEALTQNEAIQVLGQLYAANLLQADLPPDAEGLFQRYRKRKGKELRDRLANFLFARFPLLDPDRLLNALAGTAGLAFTPVGFALWAAVLAVGAYFAATCWGDLAREGRGMLDAGRLVAALPLMYAAFVLAKLVHEFSHALACKRLGRRSPGGGEVHEMGVMLLVLAPMPYVDASSAWLLRSKLHRTIIGAAGMMAELALAAGAVIAWSATADAAEPWQRATHALCYQVILIASLATVVFNANPLLRFDGYYILSDLLEIPNLSERSRLYLLYLVKRLAWGVDGLTSPANSAGEAGWMVAYGLASAVFRVFICVQVVLLLAERYFVVGLALAVAAAGVWGLVPLGKFVHYLLASPELQRTRGRAIATTGIVLVALVAGMGLVKVPDRWRVEGFVEPAQLAVVHAQVDGFVRQVLPTDQPVAGPDANAPHRDHDPNSELGTLLLAAENRELQVERQGLLHQRQATAARQRLARLNSAHEPRYLALVQTLDENLAQLDRQTELLDGQIRSLVLRAPLGGTWVCPQAERLDGAFLRHGQGIGMVATLDRPVVRATAGQRLAGMLIAEADRQVEMRLAGRPEEPIGGSWRILPAEQDSRLRPWDPSPAGPDGGTWPQARSHPAAQAQLPAEQQRGFAIEVTPTIPASPYLLPGQRVVVQFQLPPKPLLAQWWRSIRQLGQQRFGI
jgi:putative peptide zinc metalloprotease protein